MKRTLAVTAVVSVALMALPLFAEQKKPTPTATPSANRSSNLNSSRSNRVVKPTATPTPVPDTSSGKYGKGIVMQREKTDGAMTVAPSGSPADQQLQKDKQPNAQKLQRIKGRVLSQQGRRDRGTFTILSNGKEFTFSAAKTGDYWVIPKVGDTVEVTYTQTSGGTLEAVTVKGSKSNSDN